MKKKIKYGSLIVWNCFRVPILRLLSHNRIKIGFKQLISPFTRIECNSGCILVRKSIHTEKNVLLSCDQNAKLIFEGNAYINRNSMIVAREEIRIGSGTTIGPNVIIYDHDHNIENDDGWLKTGKIIIGNNCWIGANCIILRGVQIGDNSVVGAGTVVTKNVPDNTIAYNNASLIMKNRSILAGNRG